MASLQKRGDVYSCIFYWQGKRQWFSVGAVDEDEAESKAAQVDYLLMRLKQGLLFLPAGVDIVEFVKTDGKATVPPEAPKPVTTLKALRDRYVTAHEGAHESNTLYTTKIHLQHFITSLGETFPLDTLTLAGLQKYADGRAKKDTSPVTVRKEIHTFRAVWNWGKRLGLIEKEYPGRGIVYRKGREKPPFQTMTEIERKVDRGGLSDMEQAELWDSLYLTATELPAFLDHVKEKARHPWIYPMVVTAAHTAARRSELMRARVSDVDFDSSVLTVREKKRDRSKTTTRRVPLSPLLRSVLTDWLRVHPGGQYLFCSSGAVVRSKTRREAGSPITTNEAHHHLGQTLNESKWSVVKGWHVLRHSCLSALASQAVDQRIIDDIAGHQTDEQRRRYRHLHPTVVSDAIAKAFG